MRTVFRVAVAAMIVAAPAILRADDLRGSDRLLCSAVQATACIDGGDCIMDVPANLNVPQFIEVDLAAKRLQTTKASGENRATPVEHLRREGGTIVLQGYEGERAFSIMINEATGSLTAAVARDGRTVAVFGACTPLVARP